LIAAENNGVVDYVDATEIRIRYDFTEEDETGLVSPVT